MFHVQLIFKHKSKISTIDLICLDLDLMLHQKGGGSKRALCRLIHFDLVNWPNQSQTSRFTWHNSFKMVNYVIYHIMIKIAREKQPSSVKVKFSLLHVTGNDYICVMKKCILGYLAILQQWLLGNLWLFRPMNSPVLKYCFGQGNWSDITNWSDMTSKGDKW